VNARRCIGSGEAVGDGRLELLRRF
jgi:hypothetical protein